MVLVRASRYFLPMARQRLSVEDVKDYWFKGDPTVCTINSAGEVWALPRCEVQKGLKYHKKIHAAKTIGEAQKVFEEWTSDSSGPRALPAQLIDFKDQPDYLVEIIENAMEENPSFFTISIEEVTHQSEEKLLELAARLAFNVDECPVYKDESGTVVLYSQPSEWTDFWIPMEIAVKIGTPDEGFGIDYEPAEYLYLDLNRFKEEFEKVGFEVLLEDKDLYTISGW